MKRICCLFVALGASAAITAVALGFGFSDESRLPHKGVLGRPFSLTLKARGGSYPHSFKIDSGTLPPGLTMSSNGLIAGVPTKTGSYMFWGHTMDPYGLNSEREIYITIEEPNASNSPPVKPGDTSMNWPKPGWNLTFHDEFSGKELDLTNFVPRFDNFANTSNPCVVQGGIGRLRMDQVPTGPPATRPDGQGERGPRIATLETREAHNGYAQKYGWFEVRARLPQGPGLLAGFWVLPIDKKYRKLTMDGGSRASADEAIAIDVFEYLGKDPKAINFAARFGKDETDEGRESNRVEFPFSLAEDFHVYALEWDADKIIWYVDGKEVHRSDKSPQSPCFIRMALAEGGSVWRGPVDRSAYPKDFEIDYVRIYAKAPAAGKAAKAP
jgi:hypothetical protein